MRDDYCADAPRGKQPRSGCRRLSDRLFSDGLFRKVGQGWASARASRRANKTLRQYRAFPEDRPEWCDRASRSGGVELSRMKRLVRYGRTLGLMVVIGSMTVYVLVKQLVSRLVKRKAALEASITAPGTRPRGFNHFTHSEEKVWMARIN